MNTAIMKRILIAAMLCLTLLSLSTPSMSYMLPNYYKARIIARGTLTLTDPLTSETTQININATFNAKLPKQISPGEYTANFEGVAQVTETSKIELAGLISIRGFRLSIRFEVKTSVNVTEGKYQASGTFLLKITQLPKEHPGIYIYPATINATGNVNLKSLKNEIQYEIDINVSFSAAVPSKIEPGTYSADFLGMAVICDNKIKFSGVLSVEGYNFWVRFVYKQPSIDLEEGFYSATGALIVTIQKITLEELGVTWVMMRGRITHYGDQEAIGGILAYGKIGEWFRSHGALILNFSPGTPLGQNLTLYQFVLKNCTDAEINYEGKDLYVEGLWNVYNITLTRFDEEFMYNRTLIVEEGYGQLNVTLGTTGGNFTLDIDGIQLIRGLVAAYHVKYCRITVPKGVPVTDLNGDWKVNILDIIKVARAYGSMVGKERYSFDFDFNMDLIINIIDITTIARDYGVEY